MAFEFVSNLQGSSLRPIPVLIFDHPAVGPRDSTPDGTNCLNTQSRWPGTDAGRRQETSGAAGRHWESGVELKVFKRELKGSLAAVAACCYHATTTTSASTSVVVKRTADSGQVADSRRPTSVRESISRPVYHTHPQRANQRSLTVRGGVGVGGCHMVESKVGPVVSKPGWATWRRHGLALVSPRRFRNWRRLVLARCFHQCSGKTGCYRASGSMRRGSP